MSSKAYAAGPVPGAASSQPSTGKALAESAHLRGHVYG